MNYSFHPEAKKEFFKAINYFEECQKGLGLAFSKEIYSTIQRIIHFPSAWSKFSKNTRRCLTSQFPYGVIYQMKGEEVIIIAVMQLNRKPGYWDKRIKKSKA
jgi:ParE toxin of type II toxin-antitoxin system, parDE